MGEVNATRQDVARLFARAAFGATAQDLDQWTGAPYSAAVESLLAVPEPAMRIQPDDVRRLALMQGIGTGTTPRAAIRQAQRWWLERMRTSPYRLLERMVLFWHDHFATAYTPNYPDMPMMLLQNQTLRDHALGSFRVMCEAITLDPAMLWWLNGNENRKGKPNENYARELFELFTLGTVPQVYTENDIRESARALTGWTVDARTRQVSFVANRHDTGYKLVLGRGLQDLGNLEYKEIIDIALAQKVAPLFVAYKIVLNFGYEPVSKDLIADPDPLITAVASALVGSNWNLGVAMRTLLNADAWRYAPAQQSRQIVRQPIDLTVSLGRQVGLSLDNDNVVNLLIEMGQEPLNPPNVGGWPAGRDWLSPATTLARYDWGVTAYNLFAGTPAPLRIPLPASSDLDGWAARFGLAGLSANTRTTLTGYLASRAGATEAEKQAGLLVLLASSPDWMVM